MKFIINLAEMLRKRKPKSIGISATTYALPATTTLAKRLRKEFPNLLIILGGAHANIAGMHAAKNITSIDIVCYHSEGETIVPLGVFDKNPEAKELLFKSIRELGFEPEQFIVGNELNSIRKRHDRCAVTLNEAISCLIEGSADSLLAHGADAGDRDVMVRG